MSKIIGKNFPLCFPNFIKCLPTIQAPPEHASNELDHENQPPRSSTTNTSCTSLMIKNFLYNDFNLINSSSDHSTSKSLTASSSADDDHFYSSSDSDSDQYSPPDFATIFASQRFFFSSPGQSNSIVESPDTTTKRKSSQKRMLVTKGVRVSKYSSNPYMDFRLSMEEMLEANRDHISAGESGDHVHHSTSDDMEYLHELLFCYLSLNPKHAHKDIINAFTDLLICLLCAEDSSTPTLVADDRQEQPETH